MNKIEKKIAELTLLNELLKDIESFLGSKYAKTYDCDTSTYRNWTKEEISKMQEEDTWTFRQYEENKYWLEIADELKAKLEKMM